MLIGMKWLVPTILLFCAIPCSAQPRNVYPLEGCSQADVREAIDAFARESAPSFDLYVVCVDKSWTRILSAHRFPSTVAAMTDWKESRIFIGPKPLRDTVLLRHTVEHELEHLRCRCDLGESR
jgi:hypothetical protein